MKSIFYKKFVLDDTGATALEYGFLVAFIALAVVAVLPAIGLEIGAVFQNIAGFLDGAPS